MQSNFELCLKMMLAHEGGFVNHPKDPGGMTNLGVTKRVWEEWVGHEVDEKQMRELTPEKVAPLYARKYWDAVRANELVSGLDYAVFDVAVNSGPGRAIKFLQSCVGVVADGGFGPRTMAAVKAAESDPAALIEMYSAKRLEFLQSLKTFETFGKGWSRRVAEVKEKALSLAKAGA
jgi:lysozyme family protein